MRIIDKIKEVGLEHTLVGIIKTIRYTILKQRFCFDDWNTSPYELRRYIQDAAKYINGSNPDCVIDVGCGLGELLRNVKAKKRIGVDRGAGEIMAARYLDRTSSIDFRQGTLETNNLNGIHADFLTTFGFTHGSEEGYWKPIYTKFLEENDVKIVMADVFPKKKGQYSLNYREILPSDYSMTERLGPYKGERWIEIYRKGNK